MAMRSVRWDKMTKPSEKVLTVSRSGSIKTQYDILQNHKNYSSKLTFPTTARDTATSANAARARSKG